MIISSSVDGYRLEVITAVPFCAVFAIPAALRPRSVGLLGSGELIVLSAITAVLVGPKIGPAVGFGWPVA